MAFGCILAGLIMGKFGRKTLLLVLNVLFVIGWIIFCFSAGIYGLLLGRFVTGFCVGLLSPLMPVYISEITQPTYRGLFLSLQGVTVTFGIFMSHALGIYVKWKMVAVICATIPFISYILVAMIPESPSWLLDNEQIDEAAKSFTWFRGYGAEAMDEWQKLVEGQKLSKMQNDAMGFKNILTMARTKSFYKPFVILLIYFATFQFSGANVITFYTITILKNSLGDNINEYSATMIVDISRFGTSVLSCIVVKKIGRRPLTTFSGIATTISLFGLSAYLHAASTNEHLKSLYAIPLIFFTLFIVFNTIGLNPLAWILTGELFPLRFRNIGTALVTFSNFVWFFISVKTTPGLFIVIGERVVFLLFGLCCLIGTMVLSMILTETRNKTLQEIEDSYGDKTTDSLKTIQI